MSGPGRAESEEPAPDTLDQSGDADEAARVPADIQEVSFPVAMRGYDRRAVDDYVTRVKSLIAEFEAARSPEAAVRHALEQVAEQTSGILEQVGETAENITLSARRQAEDTTASAEKEAAQIVAQARNEADELLARSNGEAETLLAEARKEAAEHRQRTEEELSALRNEAEELMRRLQSDTDAVRDERRELIVDVREIAARVEAAADEADERFPPQTRDRAGAEPVPDTEPGAATEAEGAAGDGRPTESI